MKPLILKILGTRFLDITPISLISLFLLYQCRENSLHFYFGLGIFCIGTMIWLLGIIHLGKSFQGLPSVKGLITTGIYSKFKHPIYVGSMLFFFGLSLATLYWWVVLFTLSILIAQILRARVEERKLMAKFGNKYLAYKKTVWF